MKAGQCYRSQYSKVDVEENRFRKLQTVSVAVMVNGPRTTSEALKSGWAS